MEFKAQRRTLKVTIDEKVYNVKFPLSGQIEEWRENSKGKPGEEAEDSLKDLLAELGLPREAIKQLEIADYQEIVRILTNQKKI